MSQNSSEALPVGTVPVAVVGVSALFPGSIDKTGFWSDILAGRDLLGDVPESHWKVDDYFDPDPSTPDHFYAQRGGFLDAVDFTPMDYGIPPKLLESTDSAQLLALVVAKKVLEDAAGGDFTAMDRSRMSVILGVASTTELVGDMCSRLQRPVMRRLLEETGASGAVVDDFMRRFDGNFSEWNEATFPGLLGNVVAGRIANRFDLGGTNMVVDAACASSLAAVEIALNELYLGDSDVVITGGVDCLNNPLMYMCFARTTALSPTGDCRPFSDQADGTMLGEGLGMVALKRLDDAERDGDRIYAVIRGLGASSDGRAKSIYAPVARGQAVAMRRAYEKAGYGPETVELVEAHGTGTKAGDVEEFSSVTTVFSESGRSGRWAQFGSVKSQIGHTKAAAGAAGLFKIVMALHHKVLPPTAKVERPNPKLKIEESPFYLSTEPRPWIRDASHPRRASVSAFGFGGTNFHVTAEEYTGSSRADRTRFFDSELLVVSGDPGAIVERCRTWANDVLALKKRDDRQALLRWLAFESQQSFCADDQARLAIVCTAETLADKLDRAASLIEKDPEGTFSSPQKIEYASGSFGGEVGVLFPGQGSQYVGMGAAQTMVFDSVRRVFDAAESDPRLSELSGVVFAPTAFDEDTRAEQQKTLRRTEWAQPAIGVLSLGLYNLLETMGLKPAAFAGHSYGELTALRAAGVLDDPAFFALSRERGERMAEAASKSHGAMTAVAATIEEVEALIDSGSLEVCVANHNAPEQVVVSGEVSAIERFEESAAKAGHDVRRLRVATAFHSPVVRGAVEPFSKFMDELEFAEPDRPVYANSTAEVYGDIRQTLADQITCRVRFVESIEAMWDAGIRTFVEVGPGNVLSRLVEDTLKGRPGLRVVSTDHRKVEDLTTFWTGLAKLSVGGIELCFNALWDGWQRPLDPREREAPTFSVSLNGANYGKPYTSAAPPRQPSVEDPSAGQPVARPEASPQDHPMSQSYSNGESRPNGASRAPERSEQRQAPQRAQGQPSDAWLEAYRAIQHETARAHAEYQRAIAENHNAFLRFAETSIRSLVEARGEGAAPQMPMPDFGASESVPEHRAPEFRAPAPRPEHSPQPAQSHGPVYQPSARSESGFKLPNSSNGASGRPFTQASSAPNGAPVNGVIKNGFDPVPPPASTIGQHTDSLEKIMLETVADKTGYPVDMLDSSMQLEADLGIDSIKRVEILSSVQDAARDLPDVDTTTLAQLSTLGEIVDYLESLRTTASGSEPVQKSEPVQNGQSSARDFEALMLEAVADKTGYPIDMLDASMQLEADLGVDSIKRVEILSSVQDAAPELPEVDTSTLATMSTLGEIIAYLESLPGGEAHGSTETGGPPGKLEARRVVQLETTTRRAMNFGKLSILSAQRVAITSDALGVGAALSESLTAAGHEPSVVELSEVDPQSFDALIVTLGLEEAATVDDAVGLNATVFSWVRHFAERFDSGGAHTLVLLQNTGADFGASGAGVRAYTAGIAALAKTARHEFEAADVKAIDIDPQGGASETADLILDEILHGGPEVEVALSEEARRTLVSTVSSLDPISERTDGLEPGDVVLVSGGARGVTAGCVIEWARQTPAHFVLLGRTEPLAEDPFEGIEGEAKLKAAAFEAAREAGEKVTPRDVERTVRHVLASREINGTLQAIQEAGASAEYVSVDVRDREGLRALVRRLEADRGKVSALVHAAGVLADGLIATKDDDAFARVFDTKVDGLRALLESVDVESLCRVVFFSSVSARYGNAGQADYAMANEVLNKVALDLRSRAVHAVSIGWGPWNGGMVTPALKAHFESRGVELIEPGDGARAFVDEIFSGEDGEVVVGAALDTGEMRVVTNPRPALFDVSRATTPDLDDHRVQGTVVVPMAQAVEWMARYEGRSAGIWLEDLRVLKGVRIDNFDDGVRFAIRRDGSKILVSEVSGESATLEASSVRYSALNAQERALDSSPFDHPSGWSSITSEVFYESPALFHDTAYQCVEEVALASVEDATPEGGSTARAAHARVRGGRRSQSGRIFDVVALDAALQVAVYQARQVTGSNTLPLKMARFAWTGAGFCEDYEVDVEFVSVSSTRVIANVAVFSSGCCIAEVGGLELFVIPSEA